MRRLRPPRDGGAPLEERLQEDEAEQGSLRDMTKYLASKGLLIQKDAIVIYEFTVTFLLKTKKPSWRSARTIRQVYLTAKES